MGLKINREDNGAVSIQSDELPINYYTGLQDVTVKANRKTVNGISIINSRIGVLMFDLSELEEINGAPAPADRDDAMTELSNSVFTATLP